MPLDIPKAEKIYTTKYADLKGVDYTNDPSNVWYRRSPNGVNMLPDLDGKPFKRNGWKIEFNPVDFLIARYGEYDETQTYKATNVTVYDGKLYVSAFDSLYSTTTGTFDPDDWIELVLDNFTEYDNTSTYNAFDFCKHNGQIFQCNSTISVAEDFDSSHWDAHQHDFVQYKVDYFELGGEEWLAFYTSQGLYFYSTELMHMSEYNCSPTYHRSKTGLYNVGDFTYTQTLQGVNTYYRCKQKVTTPSVASTDTTHWDVYTGTTFMRSFPPKDADDDGLADIDYEKSFFFEGQGKAGYYLFAGTKLFMFDGELLNEVNPKKPVVLIGCDPDGVGTLYEGANLLTEWREVRYSCDGSTTAFKVPQGFDTSGGIAVGIWLVYIRNASGKWEITNSWSVQNAGEVTMDSAPVVRVQGEDNLRIIYKPAGATATESTVPLSKQTLKVRKTITETRVQEWNGSSWVTYQTDTGVSYTNVAKPTFTLSSPKKPLSANVYADGLLKNGTWSKNSSKLGISFNSYGSKATIYSHHYGKDAYNYFVGTGTTKTITNETRSLGTVNGHKYRAVIKYTHYTKSISVRIRYNQWKYSATELSKNRNAFASASRSLVFGNGLINQVFVTTSAMKDFNTRVWYSAATDPSYFPDTNYIEVGATDKKIVGLIRVGDYLGVVKQGSGTDTSVYLAYPTSFEDETTYAVKQSINGVGALSNGAFNILNDEPLFLSAEGVMGIEPGEDDNRRIRNRSFYINKPLLNEPALESAISFVYDGMYWLCVNNHCYVLDGSQINSWQNTKTNLQYEAYYLDNVPALCFAKKDGDLWFIDDKSNACKFTDNYVDEYTSEECNVSVYLLDDTTIPLSRFQKTEEVDESGEWTNDLKTDFNSGDKTFAASDFNDWESVESVQLAISINGGDPTVFDLTYSQQLTKPRSITIAANQVTVPTLSGSDTAEYTLILNTIVTPEVTKDSIFSYNNDYYTVVSIDEDAETANIAKGVPVRARWGTIADDDGSAHYLKNLQKKGSLVSFLPNTDGDTKVYLKKDENEEIAVGKLGENGYTLPFHKYLKKKVKKYKRLQIICENNAYDSALGIDEIIKSYTIGNYAKK